MFPEEKSANSNYSGEINNGIKRAIFPTETVKTNINGNTKVPYVNCSVSNSS